MNDKIQGIKSEIFFDIWDTLKKITYNYTRRDGTVEIQSCEAYDRGNGATILLYHPAQRTGILTRQFRMPTFINGNADR